MFKKFLFLYILALSFLLQINTAFAYTCDCGGGKTAVAATVDQCPSACAASSNTGTVQLNNPLTGGPNSVGIPTLLGTVINVVLGVTGSLALVMFIFGGLTWMTSAGNSERVSKGKNILIWAAIGLVIIFSAYALVKFVFTSIGAP